MDSFSNCFFNIDLAVFALFNDVLYVWPFGLAGLISQKRIDFIRNNLGKSVNTSMGPKEILLAKALSFVSSNHYYKSSYTSIPIKRYGIKLLDKRNINYLKSNNQKVIAWTINKEDEMKTLIKMGVDGIMTDNLSLLKKCSY